MFVVALFNLMRRLTFHRRWINTLSSLSLLVYIIHENVIFKKATRGQLIKELYDYIGGEQLVLAVAIYSVLLFIGAYILAYMFHRLVLPFSVKLSGYALQKLRLVCGRMERNIMKFN